MAFSIGRPSISIDDILRKVTEDKILSYYLNITTVPALIKSPLRIDNNPSFGIQIVQGKVFYKDFAKGDKGGLFDLLKQMWNLSYTDTLLKIERDIPNMTRSITLNTNSYASRITNKSTTDLQCKIREWRDYDIKYWESYGITLDALKYCEVYPISHKIIIKEGQKYVFGADKYAYVYVERKEGVLSLKIYQPFNKRFKWANKNDGSVLALWTKLPPTGDKVCICSSVKDALCLRCNLGVPTVAVQGEGYAISDTAMTELKNRFKEVYVCYDTDDTGTKDSAKLVDVHSIKNVEIPPFIGGKDISDYYKVYGKQAFLELFGRLFSIINSNSFKIDDELPF